MNEVRDSAELNLEDRAVESGDRATGLGNGAAPQHF